MKKSYTLVFLVCVILCLGLTVSLANKVENSGVNFEDGNVNLERGYIYLFESITLPRIEWGEVENYETNDNNAAKKYTTSNTHSIQDECLVNAIVVDRLGECRLGRWTTDSNGCFSFRTVLSYAPELWEMDKQDVRDVQLMYYSQTYTWHPKFSNYKEFLTGIKGFKFIQDKGKVQILCQLIDFNSDKKFTNGCFYIATQWVIVNDLKIKDKIKDETAGSCWIGDINKIKKQAEDDSEYAQWTLGNMYLYGVGVEKSPKLAMKWYQLAATNGFLKACYKVKDFTFVRLKESEVIKTKTLLKRAEQGDTEAQCAMGIAYVRGEGVEHSYQKAAHWFLLAAQKGNMDAQNYLGNAYAKGEGVKQSDEDAFEWFLAAAIQGHQGAQARVLDAYVTGKGVTQSDENARKWLLLLAKRDNAIAQLYLAFEYYHQAEYEKAREWVKRAEDNGLVVDDSLYEQFMDNRNVTHP